MLSDMYGDDFTKKDKAMLIMEQLTEMEADLGGSPLITVDGWKEFLRSHGSMLFPAFRFQKRLREKVNGRRYWEKVARKRQLLSETDQRFPRLHVARERALAAARAAGDYKEPPPPPSPPKEEHSHDPKYGKLKSPSSKETNYNKLKNKQRKRKKTVAYTPVSSRNGSKVVYPFELPGTGLTPNPATFSGSEGLDDGTELPGIISLKDVSLNSVPDSVDLTRLKKLSTDATKGVIIRSTQSRAFSEYEKGNIISVSPSAKNRNRKKKDGSFEFCPPKSSNNNRYMNSRSSLSTFRSSYTDDEDDFS